MTAPSLRRGPRSRMQRWLVRLLLGLAALITLLPLVYQLGLSVKPDNLMFGHALEPFSWPLTLSHYQHILQQLPMGHYLVNSLLFAGGVTLGQLLIGLLAAYVFAVLRPRGHQWLFNLVLVSMMVPFVVTYLPNYLLMSRLGLLNTLGGMILPLLGSGYAIFLLRQNFLTFPVAILEAAAVDGATRWQSLWRILIPANLGGIISLTVYLFIQAWNQFLWPQLVARGDNALTLTVAVQRFANGEGGNAWGDMMAAATLATLPSVLLYLLLSKNILRNLQEGGLKG